MHFVPHTDTEVAEMLASMGLSSVEELFDAVPAALRLEAGLPLHGHELGPGITPAQAGLDWVVAWGKGEFRGREALEEERKRGVERLLRGLEVEGRQPPRAGYNVMMEGAPVGQVTSGNFSPTLGRGIALAFLPPPLKEGASVSVDARGQRMPAKVVYPPFVTRRRS